MVFCCGGEQAGIIGMIFYVYFLTACIEHFFMWNMIFAILCLKMVDWNLYFIINGSDSYIWLTSQIHSPIVDLCSKSEGIQVNLFSMLPTKMERNKVWYLYSCKCHIIKYFSERRERPFFFCSQLAFFMTWSIFRRLGSSGFPFQTRFLADCVHSSGARGCRTDSLFSITPVPLVFGTGWILQWAVVYSW